MLSQGNAFWNGLLLSHALFERDASEGTEQRYLHGVRPAFSRVSRSGRAVPPPRDDSGATAAMLLLALAFLLIAVMEAGAGVGVIRIDVRLSGGEPFEVAVFYPTDEGTEITAIGPYDVRAEIDAPASTGSFPLVVISHGSLASMLSHHDLASYLAHSGFVVAAVEHTGDNYKDRSGLGRLENASNRVKEVSAAIDALLEGPLRRMIDAGRIGVVGYSAGATTALMLAGATPVFEALIDYCAGMSRRTALCEAGGRRIPGSAPLQVLPDRRIGAVFLLAPIGAVFPSKNLPVTIPVGIVAAGSDQEVPLEQHVEPLVEGLSNLVVLDVIPLAGHSVFLAPCSDRLKAVERELCTDPPLVDRVREHALLNALALSFFQHAFRDGGSSQMDEQKP